MRFDSVLPRNDRADQVADPSELVWFYPGKWFGVEGMVPSLQLKWLRRAEQDHEYLMLADTAADSVSMRCSWHDCSPVRCRSRPQRRRHLRAHGGHGRSIRMGYRHAVACQDDPHSSAGSGSRSAGTTALNIETLQWTEPQEKPLVLGRSTLFESSSDGKSTFASASIFTTRRT